MGFPWLHRSYRIYGLRTKHLALGTGLSEPILFLHLPKCGGTSLAQALSASVSMRDRVANIDAISTRRAAAIGFAGVDDPDLCHDDGENGARVFALREQQLLTYMAWDARLIHGHILYSAAAERHFGERYRLVTLMRDPVARSVSNYCMLVRRGLVPPAPDLWMDSVWGRNQSRQFLRYLSGRANIPEAETATALETALARLDRFALIGRLDDLDGFRRAFRGITGVTLRIGRQNVGTHDEHGFTPAQLERLTEMCAPDIAIWQAAIGG